MREYTLQEARIYEQMAEREIFPEERPVFHLSPRVGWMNDPNGFSWYHDQYHLFYQYYPYRTQWDAMHWGHAVSDDLVHWKYLPATLAPDQPFDRCGCFSGSAETLQNGRQMLLYTGVFQDEAGQECQAQCVAIGDGLNYEKLSHNPVISASTLPAELSHADFRDPCIWRTSDGFRCVVAGCTKKDHLGVILQYGSKDGIEWHLIGELTRNRGNHGRMWECPDFFELEGKWILSVSPQDMLPEKDKYISGNGTVCLIGDLDNAGARFIPESDQPVDYGLDFYAPQTMVTPDGRRVMIGWMQNWDTCGHPDEPGLHWFNQMTVVRELGIRNGKLVQWPIRELEKMRNHPLIRKGIRVSNEFSMPELHGRIIDLTVRLYPTLTGKEIPDFCLRIAQSEDYYTELRYSTKNKTLTLDRTWSGSRRNFQHQRTCKIETKDGAISLRILVDRFSVEAFINGGEQAMTAAIRTDLSADGISLWTESETIVDIEKYDMENIPLS